MKFTFKFSNLLGTVYRKGNILFSPSGDTVISLVGNRITFYDIKNNKSETLPIESRFNFDCIALSPNGYVFIVVNEVGEALLCSLVSRSVINHHYFKSKINSIKFSPDGRRFAITKDNEVFVYRAPGKYQRDYNPFTLERAFKGSFDETVCLDWSSDSRVLAAGSKDMTTKVYAVDRFTNMRMCTLGSHTDCIVSCFFEENSLDMITISRNGQLCIWESSENLENLIPWKPNSNQSTDEDKSNPGDDEEEMQSDDEMKTIKKNNKDDKKEEDGTANVEKVYYKRLGKYFLRDGMKRLETITCTSAAYHQKTHILVTGYSHGAFLLHELPECNLIHSLSMSDHPINTISINPTGDWITLASSALGQLIVWEWQSESFVMKQQGHFNNMNCLTYSPDGQYIVTGGDDGKVKIWSTNSGFCFVTFHEHKSGISSVCFTQSGKVILSASLDGTVRAYDMTRYRNFRTFTSPRPVQFSCMTVDSSGDIICAASQDTFEIFVWSLKNGRLLEVLSGHEAPVSGISFSPTHAVLVSSSWDKTVRVWDVFESKGNRETIDVITDALDVVFRPDGEEFAVSTLNGQLTFFDSRTVAEISSIDGRHDVGLSARDTDLVSAKKLQFGKAFNTLCYTADGECILAAGRSKYVCIYNVLVGILMKKFELTCNLSLDGINDMVNRRKLTEFGNLALIEGRDDIDSISISLPGVKKGDMASRSFKPEIRVSSIQFSPTGRAWAAATTEGLLVYSLDNNRVFDPFDLDADVTVSSVKEELKAKNYGLALTMAFRLNEENIISEVIENIPSDQVQFISQSMTDKYVEKILNFLGVKIESSAHVEFYLNWIHILLQHHGQKLKNKSLRMLPTLRLLQKNLGQKFEALGKICDHNTYLMQYSLKLGETKLKRKAENDVEEDENLTTIMDTE